MAGFFGLFNYEKEGPGISKNAPKKKTFFIFFETFFRNFWKFITINLVYCIMCIPVVTNGLAAVGLTNVTRNTARDKHSFGLSDFFETIKKNWRQALPAGIINVVVYLLLIFDIYYFSALESDIFSAIGTGILLSLFFIFTIMNFYIWTLMITFNFSLKQLYKNSFKFVFLNFKKNLICFFVPLLILGIFVGMIFLLSNFFLIVLLIEIMILLITFPGFQFLLTQYCVFPAIQKFIIDPYYRDHPNEDIEKRRSLGLEVEEEKKTEEELEEEIVFED